MNEPEIIEGELVHLEESPRNQEVVVAEAQQATLFRTTDPVEVVQAASRVADALKNVLASQNLTTNIQGRAHVRVEGWQTVGSMLGVFAVKEWVEELPWPEPVPDNLKAQKEQGKVFGYKSSYRAQRTDGAVVGSGEAECKRTERTWATRDDFAVKNMTQTRAMSRALRAPLGFIVTMAGYEPTPAEEMPVHDEGRPFGPPMGMNDREMPEKLSRALTYMTGSADLAIAVYQQIEKDSGYVPNVVARSILRVAVAMRDHGVVITTTDPAEGAATE